MATSYTTLLGLALPVQGELQGVWGNTVNDYITTYLDAAVAGTQNISTDADVTLTKTTGTALTGTSSQYSILLFSGSRAAQRTVTVPAASKSYVVINATTGGFAVKVVGAGPTTGVTIANGEKAVIAWNGSDFIKVSTFGGDPTFGNVTVTGTTTLSGLTASTALALNASKEVVSVTNTGTGNNVLATSPTLTTPTLGVATATSINKVAITAPATAATLTIADGKTLTANNSITLAGTDATTMTFPTTSASIARTDAAQTFTGTQTFSSNPILNGGTANGVLYLDGSKVATSGTDLVFNATGLGIGTSSPGEKLNVVGGGSTSSTVNFTGGSNNDNATIASDYSLIFQVDANNNVGGRDFNWRVGGKGYSDGTSLMVLDASGNLGLGVTPSAWGSGNKAIQLGTGSVATTSLADINNNTFLINGAYFDGSSYRYVASSFPATRYLANSGAHSWSTAPSGTAGNTISFTQAMTLDASGNLGIGVTSIPLYANYKNIAVGGVVGGAIDFIASNIGVGNNRAAQIFTASGALAFATGASDTVLERMRLDSSGNLGLGVTPSAWNSNFRALQIGARGSVWSSTGSSSTHYSNNVLYDAGGFKYLQTGTVASYEQGGGAHYWYTAPSGTAGNAISFTQAMTLDASGNLLVGTTSASIGASGRGVIEVNGTSDSVFASKVNGTLAAVSGLASSTEVIYGAVTNVPVLFRTNNTERARITSGGYFKASDDGVYAGAANTWHEFNQSANSIGLSVLADNASLTTSVLEISAARNTTNNTYYFLDCAVAGVAYRFRVADSGDVTNTNNSYGAISDVKLKENIVDATPKLEKLNQVRVVNFNIIGSEQKQLGVIAQELEQIFPGMVDQAPDRDAEGNDLGTVTKSVKYSVFVPMLIKAIQEQQAQIAALTARLDALETN